MDTKQQYQQPKIEIIELCTESLMAGSLKDINYTTGGKGSVEDVNNFWNQNNPLRD